MPRTKEETAKIIESIRATIDPNYEVSTCNYCDLTAGIPEGYPWKVCWFSPHIWILGRLLAPAFEYICDGKTVQRNVRPEWVQATGATHLTPKMVWVLTDEFDEQHFQKGVWPD